MSPTASATGDLKHHVFVYGTLKRGFFNFDRFLGGKEAQWRLVSDTAVLRRGAAAFFVDTYWTPYFVFATASDHGQHQKHGDAEADGSSALKPIAVRGEVFAVDDSLLQDLDELEGVARGRYTRTEVIVELKEQGSGSGAGDEIAEQSLVPLKCYVYHLKTVPSTVLSQVCHIDFYDLELHKKNYVIKEDRDATKYDASWGGYL